MRSLLAHALLATLGLGAAFWVWSAGEQIDRPAEAVTLFSCSQKSLEEVTLATAKKQVTIKFERIEGDLGGWITVKTPNAATPTAPSVDRFAASDKVTRVAGRLAPLVAERSLGDVDNKTLQELGLDDGDHHISLRCGGESRSWRLGKKTYGGRTRYARSKDGGAVHLLANALVADMEMAEFRFMQRDLVRLRLETTDSVVIAAPGGSKTLLHRNRRDRTKAMWVDEQAPTQRNELYGNWLTKLTRLRALDYLEKGAKPGADLKRSTKPTPILTLTLKGEGSDRIELVKVPGDKSADDKFYARSETTRSWVTVPRSLAQQVADDVATVLGVESADAAPAAASATATGAPTR